MTIKMKKSKTEIRVREQVGRLKVRIQKKKLALHVMRRKRFVKVDRLANKMDQFDAMRAPQLAGSLIKERKLMTEIDKLEDKLYLARKRVSGFIRQRYGN